MTAVQNPTEIVMVPVIARRNAIAQAPYAIKSIDIVDYMSRVFARVEKRNLAIPVVGQADLDAIELWVLYAEIRIRDMRPVRSDIPGSIGFGG